MAETQIHQTAPVVAEPNGVDPNLADQKKKRPDQSYWSLVKHQYRKNKPAMVALYFIYFMFIIAIFADFLANNKPIICSVNGSISSPILKHYLVGMGLSHWEPASLANVDWRDEQSVKYDWKVFPPINYLETDTDPLNSFTAPFETSHLLGTDQLGHDVLSGLIHGSRISLTIGFVSMAIASIIGIILGALAGYFMGWVDMLISRIIEIFQNFPSFFLIIIIVAFLGANIFYVMMVIGITGWMGIARLVRGEVLRTRNLEFVTAARSLGLPNARIIFRHVMPNAISPVLVSIAFGIAGAILTESGLAFLGFGVPAEMVTWGSTLNAARQNPYAWWMAIFPGLMIFFTVASYNLIGDGLRDALDPKLRD